MPNSDPSNKVTYKTFINDLTSQSIQSADLYTHGTADFTYTTKAGELRSVEIPYNAAENDLLIHSLKSQSIEYVAHDSPYPHDDKSELAYAQWASVGIFIVPLLLVGIVFYQARVISKLSTTIAETNSNSQKSPL